MQYLNQCNETWRVSAPYSDIYLFEISWNSVQRYLVIAYYTKIFTDRQTYRRCQAHPYIPQTFWHIYVTMPSTKFQSNLIKDVRGVTRKRFWLLNAHTDEGGMHTWAYKCYFYSPLCQCQVTIMIPLNSFASYMQNKHQVKLRHKLHIKVKWPYISFFTYF